MFKAKPVEERAEFVKKKWFFFNCINSVAHFSRSCKSSVRYRAPECGKPHHTLLHLPRPSPERNVVHQASNVETMVIPTVPMAPPDGQNATSSTCATATAAESSEILLQIIPLKVIGNNGRSITTYSLVDSGSDVTMIDPSLIKQLEIQGETVSARKIQLEQERIKLQSTNKIHNFTETQLPCRRSHQPTQ